MDFFNILKEFSKSEKDIFSCFCILLPLCFTLLYFYIPEFKNLEMYLQTIFTSAFSIGCVYLSFIAHAIPLQKCGFNDRITKMMLILPTIAISSTLIPIPYLHDLGYNLLSFSIVVTNIIFGIICFVAYNRK